MNCKGYSGLCIEEYQFALNGRETQVGCITLSYHPKFPQLTSDTHLFLIHIFTVGLPYRQLANPGTLQTPLMVPEIHKGYTMLPYLHCHESQCCIVEISCFWAPSSFWDSLVPSQLHTRDFPVSLHGLEAQVSCPDPHVINPKPQGHFHAISKGT